MTRMGERRDDKRSKPPLSRFTPLTTPIDQVLMQIKDEGALTFPRKLREILTNDLETNTVSSTVITVMTRLIATT